MACPIRRTTAEFKSARRQPQLAPEVRSPQLYSAAEKGLRLEELSARVALCDSAAPPPLQNATERLFSGRVRDYWERVASQTLIC
jgi:hypothetical protein